MPPMISQMRSAAPRGDFSGDNHSRGELQGEQAGGVVGEAFALDDFKQGVGQADAGGDGGDGDDIGGGDDGSEDGSGAPVKAGDEEMRDEGDSDDGEGDEDRAAWSATEVGAELAPRCVERAGKDERRKKWQKDERRVEGDVRMDAEKAEAESSQDENDGVGGV